MQLVVGLLLDRFGGRRPLALSAVVLALGCVVFALGTSIGWMGAGRFLMGLGSAFAYVGTIYIATGWFPRRRMALIAGLTAALGMVGAMVGQAVLGLFLIDAPWRGVMWFLAGGGLVMGVIIWMLVPDRPAYLDKRVRRARIDAGGGVFAGLAQVVQRRANWTLAVASGLLFLPIGTFASLWGDRYLSETLGMTQAQGVAADAMIFLGIAISAPALGWCADRWGRPIGIMRVSGCVSMLALIAQFWGVDANIAWLSYPLLFTFGLASGAVILAFPVAIDLNGPHLRGGAITFLNFFQMSMVFGGQWLVGVVLDSISAGGHQGSYDRTDFQWAFMVLPIAVLAAIALLFVPLKGHVSQGPSQNTPSGH
jgi:MFS family permease